jgi:hypothetical protein
VAASPFRISITTDSPCRISAYRSCPSTSGSTTPREKPSAFSRNAIDAATFATARYVLIDCIPGERPLVEVGCRGGVASAIAFGFLLVFRAGDDRRVSFLSIAK